MEQETQPTTTKTENTEKKLFIAVVISCLMSYAIIAYQDFQTYQYYNPDYTLSAHFFTHTVKEISFRIEFAFKFGFMFLAEMPLLLILPAIYMFTFYKVYFSSRLNIVKYKLFLFVFFLMSLIWILNFFGEALATF